MNYQGYSLFLYILGQARVSFWECLLPPIWILASKLLQVVVSWHHFALLIGNEQTSLPLQRRLWL